MKKILSLLLSILMLTSAVFSVNLSAYASEIASIDFEFAGEYVKGLVIYPVYVWENLGNKLTLHMSDGTDKAYVCSVKDGEKVFLASDGSVIKSDDITFNDISVVVGENPIKISYAGFTANSSFTCVSNTISGIQLAFADGVSLTEGVDLTTNGKYNISSKLYSVGNVLTVSYSNKPVEVYTCTVDASGKYYSFVKSDGKELLGKVQGYVDEKKLVPGQYNDVQIFLTTKAITTVKLMLNHNIVIDNAVSPSYFATGLSEGSHCSVCNAVITPQSVIAKKKLKSTSIKKLKKGKKQFKATWSKVTGVTGYQITYSTSSKFTKKTTKTVTVKGNKNTSKKIKKLKANKKYYVKVRTYKKQKINGKTKTAYSSYSKVKTVKTTK